MGNLFKNNFFNKNFKLSNTGKKYINRLYTSFDKFINNEDLGKFDKRFVTEINEEGNIEEYLFLSEDLLDEYLRKYNLQMLENILSFYDAHGNLKRIEDIFEENRKVLAESLVKMDSLNLEQSEKKYKEDNITVFKVNSTNENHIFFTKNIISKWIKSVNSILEEQNNLFQDENLNYVEVKMYIDVYSAEDIAKTFSMSYKVTTKNNSVNKENIRTKYYPDLTPLQFFELEESFARIKEMNYKMNENKLKFYFGNMYFELNTDNGYIKKDFEELLGKIGVNVIDLDNVTNLTNKEDYTTFSILQLFKLMLVKE